MSEKVYAVIDTNVLVSSLFSSHAASNPAKVIKAVLNGVITLLFNDDIIDEYRDVLSRAKFNFRPDLVDNLLSFLIDNGINTCRADATDEHFSDTDDIVFYEVAMSVQDAFLVTGNIKHFPQKPFVVTPSEMVAILQKKGLMVKP